MHAKDHRPPSATADGSSAKRVAPVLAPRTRPEPSEIRPFLRWAGSKRQLVPDLVAYWKPIYSRYVEPFAGSSCLFFAISPPFALLADKNAELVEVYEQVRRAPAQIYDSIVAMPRTSDEYYRVRGLAPKSLTARERAVRFVFLNRNCFNGIFRTNRDGAFNVPFATSRAGKFVTRDEFLAAAAALRTAELRAWDFGTTLRYVKAGDFVYIDPPYATTTRRVFCEYGRRPFGPEDLGRLADHLPKLVERGAQFVLSYADCKEARELGRKWTLRRHRVRRNVAGFVSARRRSNELLISSVDPD